MTLLKSKEASCCFKLGQIPATDLWREKTCRNFTMNYVDIVPKIASLVSFLSFHDMTFD